MSDLGKKIRPLVDALVTKLVTKVVADAEATVLELVTRALQPAAIAPAPVAKPKPPRKVKQSKPAIVQRDLKPDKSKRGNTCGKCGAIGYTARTCGKTHNIGAGAASSIKNEMQHDFDHARGAPTPSVQQSNILERARARDRGVTR